MTTDAYTMNHIKSCPFCGGREFRVDTDQPAIVCLQCWASGPTGFTEAAAWKGWNSRDEVKMERLTRGKETT